MRSTRFLVLSDLHLEFGLPYVPPVSSAYDAVLLAGDTHPGLRGLRWAAETWPDHPVALVPGNHEYYRQALPRLVAKMHEERARLGLTHVHVLERAAVVLDGVRVLGTSLWTDLRGGTLPGPLAALALAQGMNDYRYIRHTPGYRRLRPEDTAGEHARSVSWLRACLGESWDGPTVVMTHHAPSAQGLREGRVTEPLDAGYASALDELVASSGAACWVHGHTHVARTYACGDVPVVSNARGYPGALVPGFDPARILTVLHPERAVAADGSQAPGVATPSSSRPVSDGR